MSEAATRVQRVAKKKQKPIAAKASILKAYTKVSGGGAAVRLRFTFPACVCFFPFFFSSPWKINDWQMEANYKREALCLCLCVEGHDVEL